MFNKENRIKKIEYRQSIYMKRIFLLFSIFYSLYSSSQCAMCRAALESEGNGVKAEAINDGIVYLMVIPYLLVGAAFYYIYKLKFRKK